MLIDSHCHLDYFTPAELPDVLARAAEAGVGEMVTIGTTLEQSARLPAIAEPYPNVLVHRRAFTPTTPPKPRSRRRKSWRR